MPRVQEGGIMRQMNVVCLTSTGQPCTHGGPYSSDKAREVRDAMRMHIQNGNHSDWSLPSDTERVVVMSSDRLAYLDMLFFRVVLPEEETVASVLADAECEKALRCRFNQLEPTPEIITEALRESDICVKTVDPGAGTAYYTYDDELEIRWEHSYIAEPKSALLRDIEHYHTDVSFVLPQDAPFE